MAPLLSRLHPKMAADICQIYFCPAEGTVDSLSFFSYPVSSLDMSVLRPENTQTCLCVCVCIECETLNAASESILGSLSRMAWKVPL